MSSSRIAVQGMEPWSVLGILNDQQPSGLLDFVLLVALTGYGDAESRRRTLDAGFDPHVVNPIDPEELPRLIAAYRRTESR